MLYVKDDLSGRRFLVDTGARVSVFPASGKDTRSLATDLLLQAANGSQIKTYGERKMTISFNNKQFQWKFIIAAVTQPLLGADFLNAHSLLVDLRGQRLIDSATFSSFPLSKMTGSAQKSTTLAEVISFLLSLLTILRSSHQLFQMNA